MENILNNFKTREELINKFPMREELIREFDARQEMVNEIVKFEVSDAIKNELMEFENEALRVILIGLKEGFDISTYATKEYNNLQMEQVLCGLIQNVDVTLYNNPKIGEERMRTLRHALKEGLDVTLFNNPDLNDVQFELIHEGVNRGIDVTKYNCPTLSEYKMAQIKASLIDELTLKACKHYEINTDLCEDKEYFITMLYINNVEKEQVNRIVNLDENVHYFEMYEEFEMIINGK